jgi:hypothetical protein
LLEKVKVFDVEIAIDRQPRADPDLADHPNVEWHPIDLADPDAVGEGQPVTIVLDAVGVAIGLDVGAVVGMAVARVVAVAFGGRGVELAGATIGVRVCEIDGSAPGGTNVGRLEGLGVSCACACACAGGGAR